VEDVLGVEHDLGLDEDEEGERDGGQELYEGFAKEDWWNLAYNEALERMQRSEISSDESWMGWGLDHPITGVEIPAVVYLKKTKEGMMLWDEEIEPFIEACRGIDKAYKLWIGAQSLNKLLWRLGYSLPDQQNVPMGEGIELKPDWLETLSKMRKNGGERIAVAIEEYIKRGEEARKVFQLKNDLAWFKAVPRWEKLQVELEIKRRVDRHAVSEAASRVSDLEKEIEEKMKNYDNIFDGVNLRKKIDAIRANIRDVSLGKSRPDEKVGVLAEELAMRIFTLFGGAGAYNFTGFGPDRLASLMYPNALRWQFLRGEADPAPVEIAGVKDVPQLQPFNKMEMLMPYYEFAGDVPLTVEDENGNVGVDTMRQVMKEGCFDLVRWMELPGAVEWRVWVGRIMKVGGMVAKMSKADEEKISLLKNPKNLKGLKVDAEMVMMPERLILGSDGHPVTEEKDYQLADGRVCTRRESKKIEGEEDGVTQRLIYHLLIAAINGNSARYSSAGDRPSLAAEIKVLVDNVIESRVLTGKYASMLKGNSYLFWTRLRAISDSQTVTQ